MDFQCRKFDRPQLSTVSKSQIRYLLSKIHPVTGIFDRLETAFEERFWCDFCVRTAKSRCYPEAAYGGNKCYEGVEEKERWQAEKALKWTFHELRLLSIFCTRSGQ